MVHLTEAGQLAIGFDFLQEGSPIIHTSAPNKEEKNLTKICKGKYKVEYKTPLVRDRNNARFCHCFEKRACHN